MPALDRHLGNLPPAAREAFERGQTANSAAFAQVTERAERAGTQQRNDLAKITDPALRLSTERMTRLTR